MAQRQGVAMLVEVFEKASEAPVLVNVESQALFSLFAR